jgi:hypothetical protein
MQILVGDPVKGAEATALRRLRQAVKDLDGLLPGQLLSRSAPSRFPFEDRIVRRRDIVGEYRNSVEVRISPVKRACVQRTITVYPVGRNGLGGEQRRSPRSRLLRIDSVKSLPPSISVLLEGHLRD